MISFTSPVPQVYLLYLKDRGLLNISHVSIFPSLVLLHRPQEIVHFLSVRSCDTLPLTRLEGLKELSRQLGQNKAEIRALLKECHGKDWSMLTGPSAGPLWRTVHHLVDCFWQHCTFENYLQHFEKMQAFSSTLWRESKILNATYVLPATYLY